MLDHMMCNDNINNSQHILTIWTSAWLAWPSSSEQRDLAAPSMQTVPMEPCPSDGDWEAKLESAPSVPADRINSISYGLGQTPRAESPSGDGGFRTKVSDPARLHETCSQPLDDPSGTGHVRADWRL